MKLTKTYKITIKSKTKKECEQVIDMIKSIVDVELVEIEMSEFTSMLGAKLFKIVTNPWLKQGGLNG